MKLKIYFLLALFLFTLNIQAQKKLSIKEINWEISIPEGFRIAPDFKKPLKKSEDKYLLINDNKALLTTYYNKAEHDEEGLKEGIKYLEDKFISQIKEKEPNVSTEKTISDENISGVIFHKAVYKFELDSVQYFAFYIANFNNYTVVFKMVSFTEEDLNKLMKAFENTSTFTDQTKSN